MNRSGIVWRALALLSLPVGPALAQGADGSRGPWDDAQRQPSRNVTISLELDARGTVTSCAVTGSSGIKQLDEMSCAVVREQGKYEPILDEDGHAVPATIVQTLTWHPEQQQDQEQDASHYAELRARREARP